MPILHYMYYAKYGSGLLRVSTSYAYQGANGKQTLHPRFPWRPRHTISLQVPHAQTVATDSGDSMGCMPYRSRDEGGSSPWQAAYRFRCNTGTYHTDSATGGGIGRPLKHADSGAIRAKRFRDAPIPWV